MSITFSKLRRVLPVLISAALAVPVAANAALLQSDLPTFGASTGVQDTNTGLTWLNLNFARGLSYQDVISQQQAGGRFDGWRYATLGEWQSLYTELGFDVSKFMYIPNPSPTQRAAMASAVAVLGNLAQTNDANDMWQGGLLDYSLAAGSHLYTYWSLDECLSDRNCDAAEHLSTYGQYFSATTYPIVISDDTPPYGSSYLVRATSTIPSSEVPEPASIALLVLGAFGAAGARRRCK